MDKTFKILALTEDTKLLNSLESYFKEWGYEGFFSNSLEADISEITKISPDAIVVDVSSCEKNQLGICEFLKKDFATTYIPIIALICQQRACHELLGLTVGIDDYIVVPLDPVELRIRIEMAVKRTARSFYASPLTGLPGGKIVEEMMKERIDSRKSFVVGHADIDNFKAYNDKYGYLMGDRVIMQTAYMLSGAVRKWGTPHDFVGHIGGDDFVFLTTPEKYDTICQNFICMFDTITPFLYKEEDRKLGYVEAKGRTNRITKLPLVSMTIALVLNPRFGEIDNVISLNEKIAEIKQYLKKIPGSKYMADRRGKRRKEKFTVKMFKNEEALIDSYRPLGRILLDRNVVTGNQLDSALKVHWKSRALLGEVLKDLGFLSEKDLQSALLFQETGLEKNSL